MVDANKSNDYIKYPSNGKASECARARVCGGSLFDRWNFAAVLESCRALNRQLVDRSLRQVLIEIHCYVNFSHLVLAQNRANAGHYGGGRGNLACI